MLADHHEVAHLLHLDGERRGCAVGVFFMGIPLGIGLSFLLAGTVGSTSALTTVLLATDVLAIASIVFFALAARGPGVESAPAAAVAH